MKNQEMDDEQRLQLLMQEYQRKQKLAQSQPKQAQKSRKKVADDVITTKKPQKMQIQTKKVPKLRFQDLPQDIDMYLIQIYPFGNKLFMTGIMQNKQTLNIVANELHKQIYFVLKDEPSNVDGEMSQQYLDKAEEEIKLRLKHAGLTISDDKFYGEMVDMQYVFQIGEVPRNVRKYYKVRFDFKAHLNEDIEPDWEGQTYKYVIGTSYTALQLLIVNRRIQGPSWIRLSKHYLTQNHSNNVEVGLCVDMKSPQLIQVLDRIDPPTVRVLSFSLKSIIPATITKKKYFLKDKDDSHIYSISYHYCQQYKVSIKDQKPSLISRTYYLQQLGKPPSQQYVPCVDENTLLSRFQADINKYDPDFIVCHDSAKLLDSLICNLGKMDKNFKIKFGRLRLVRDHMKSSQNHRINSFLAGRLLVDTFLHSKDMVKAIQYNLQSVAEFTRPEKKFYGFNQEQQKNYFNEDKPLLVVTKCREQSQLTFQIMNHFQILQMTRQLSNICGNLWKRSLQNKRAQRNQFLIMHQCKKRNLIIPDKFRKDKGDEEEEEGGKKKYQGGMVFEPEKGFYSDYILLLDFNSLYPSLIRQYNICFSIIERPKLNLDFYYKSKAKKKQLKQKKQNAQNSMMPIQQINPQDDGLEQMFANAKSCNNREQWGFLPNLIHTIVEQRKKCKKKMKKASNPSEYFVLDIQQKCYKVVANSIYGCLGFSISRFYSRPLAALITKKGRDSLLRARDIVSKRGGVRVIYGDTDSLMIQPSDLKTQQNRTQIDKLKQLKKIAQQLKTQINKQYTFLQIDIDGIFKPLILLMKKKYIANKLTNFQDILYGQSNQPKFSLEFKGIEIVRRDGCKIARDIQEQVINILVKSDDSQLDTRYQQIIDLFTKLNAQIANPTRYPLQHFQFSKQLSKKPRQYTNADHLPHVKVAMDRMKAGEKQQSLVGHTIFYMICKQRSQDNHQLAKNAYDMRSYKKSQQFDGENKLEIDYDYYKSVIVEPVGKLLGSINVQIYDQIVKILEISKRRMKNIKEAIGDDIENPEQLSETVGNNLKSKLNQFSRQLGSTIKCPIKSCNQQFTYISIDNPSLLTLQCPKCSTNITKVLHNKISYKLKQHSTQYYNNRKRCRCSKTYELTPVLPCCDIDKKSHAKSDISFKLHNFMYLVQDLCGIVANARGKEVGKEGREGGREEGKEGLEGIVRYVGKFLGESCYEDVSDTFARLKL